MKRWLPDFLALLFLLVVTVVFYYKTFFGGLLPIPLDNLVGRYHPWLDYYVDTFPRGMPYKNFLITDPIRQQIPWRKTAIDAWKHQQLPGWDPASFGGNPLSHNIQSGAWYPLNVFFLWMPFPLAWTTLIISQTVGMLFFMYLYLRSQRLHPLAATFGAQMAAFSGFSIAWLTWGTMLSALMWLPLLLMILDQFTKRQSWLKGFLWFVLALVVIFCTLTAGHFQIALYVLLTTGAYSLYLSFLHKTVRPVLFLGAVGLLMMGLLYKPLWSYVQFLSTTVRGSSTTSWHEEGFFIPLQHLVQFLAPDYFGNPGTFNYFGVWNYGELVGYVGIIGLLFSLFGVRVARKLFWVGVLAFSLLLSLDTPLAQAVYLHQVPLLSSLQPTRLLSLICIALAVLAACGVDSFMRNKKTINSLFFTFLLSLLGITGYLLITSKVNSISFRNTLLPLTLLVITGTLSTVVLRYINRLRMVLVLILLLLLTADLLRFGWKFTPFVSAQYFFPETPSTAFLKQQTEPFRVMTPHLETFPSNSLGYYGIESIGGYNPLYSERFAHFFQVLQNGVIYGEKPPFQRLFDLSRYDSPLAKFANIKYVITTERIENYHLVHQEGLTNIYEMPNYLGRWYFADQVYHYASGMEALSAMLASDNQGTPAYVESDKIDALPAQASDLLEMVDYRANQQMLRVTTENPVFLVNSTAWDPSWHAFIDDRAVPIMRTNYLFMGISIPKGIHSVKFIYHL